MLEKSYIEFNLKLGYLLNSFQKALRYLKIIVIRNNDINRILQYYSNFSFSLIHST
jgi:hypothetical protein